MRKKHEKRKLVGKFVVGGVLGARHLPDDYDYGRRAVNDEQRERWRNSVRDGWPTSRLVAIHDNEYGDFDVCYLVDDKECASYRSERGRFWWYEGENFDYYPLPDVPENEE